MSSIQFLKAEVAAAIGRGVRQCVVIGSRAALREAFESAPDQQLRMFAVEEEQEQSALGETALVPAQDASEELAATLAGSDFDKLTASLFVWLGGAKYRTAEAAISSLAFIASLPRGSSVVLDYAERSYLGSLTHTALDALATRVACAGDNVKQLIHPQAVTAMLRGLGFQMIVDLTQEELPDGGHLVSAIV
jgi:O-methyltransferase involved in polyketide biosynthesis